MLYIGRETLNRKDKTSLKNRNQWRVNALNNAGGIQMNIKDLLKDAYKEGMSVEDIEKALESIDPPTDNSAEIDRLKAALSKSNSEAADFKKQLREKMSEDERKAKEEEDEYGFRKR